jgi:hypothetical protein
MDRVWRCECGGWVGRSDWVAFVLSIVVVVVVVVVVVFGFWKKIIGGNY